MNDPVNLAAKLALFHDHWRPRIVGAVNDLEIMVVKVDGEFQWHRHEETDDFFLLLKGVLEIDLREAVEDRTGNAPAGVPASAKPAPVERRVTERTVVLHPGEFFVVPRGVEHRPAARYGEAELLLIEPKGTPNTGDPATAAQKLTV